MEVAENKVSEAASNNDRELLDRSFSDRPAEDRERLIRDLKAGLHPLQNKFVLWYTLRTTGNRGQTSHEYNIKKIVDFSTVEGFWVCYCHLVRPSALPVPTDLHLFKEGIRPLWEAQGMGGQDVNTPALKQIKRVGQSDPTAKAPNAATKTIRHKRRRKKMLESYHFGSVIYDSANCNGGKWMLRFKKTVSGRFWEDLLVALVGDQLDYGDDICGAVLSIRAGEDILSVWNRNASEQPVMALKDSIKRCLKLPQSYTMEYKRHNDSLRDNSSYRNTWLRG